MNLVFRMKEVLITGTKVRRFAKSFLVIIQRDKKAPVAEGAFY